MHVLLRLKFAKCCISRYLQGSYTLSSKYSSSKSNNSSSSSSSSSDDSQSKQQRKEEAKKKLDMLLQSLVEDQNVRADNMNSLDLAKPKPKRFQNVEEPGTESTKTETVEEKLVTAVKDAAEYLGGDKKQTESELLAKLLNPVKEEGAEGSDLSSIFKGMKIDRDSKEPEQVSRAQQVRQILGMIKRKDGSQQYSKERQYERRRDTFQLPDLSSERVDLFGSEPLGIFKPGTFDESSSHTEHLNETWDRLYKRELKLAVTHPPANYFQEMILWTEQGKVWKFPIDNEQGLEEEQKVYFTEHIFLEKHLEPWCPQKGPIRHFMELVCVGLSKNSYITVNDKKEHIEWFRNYFEEKKQLLREVGAVAADHEFLSTTDVKQLES